MMNHLTNGNIEGGEADTSSSSTIGHNTQNMLDHTSEQLQHVQPQRGGSSWPLRSDTSDLGRGVQSAATPNNTPEAMSTDTQTSVADPTVTENHTTNHVNQIDGGQQVNGPLRPESLAVPVRSSFEILGCVAPTTQASQLQHVAGVGPSLSRPPSCIPDFGFVVFDSDPLPPEPQVVEQQEKRDKDWPCLLFSISLVSFAMSLLTITASGAVMTALGQVDKPVPYGYTACLVVGLVVLVFSAAALGHVLGKSPKVLTRIKSCAQALSSTISWPHMCWPRLRPPRVRWPFTRRGYSARSVQQPPEALPDPDQFELDDLELQQPRPDTPFPGLARPDLTHSPQGQHQTLPLGFPFPPASGVNRMNSNSAVSRMSNMSFQSAPRTVSPLSDMPPTPPPKEPSVSRFQSQEPLLTAAPTREAIAQSDTRASILTTLCDAVQFPNPVNQEPGPAAQHYSPLVVANSPATGTTSRNASSIQSPRPTYPIRLASPSRFREHEV